MDAENAAQQDYIKVLEKKKTREIQNPSGYAWRLARKMASGALRRRRSSESSQLTRYGAGQFDESAKLDMARQYCHALLAHSIGPEDLVSLSWFADIASFDEIVSWGKLDVGVFYSAATELALPDTRIITDVTQRLHVASTKLAERLKNYPEGVHDLTPRQFEELVGELLADAASGHVEITPFTRDGGRDLLAYVDLRFGRLLCLIEAKKYRPNRPVGIDLVRTLYGVVCDEDASQGTLVTTSNFSAEARTFESRHRHRLSLQDYYRVAEWIRRYRTPRS